jgi:O-succinylbenzoate synthase
MQTKSANVASSHAVDAASVTISNIEMRTVRLPLHEPFEASFGRIDSRLIFLVTVSAEDETGWGEVVAFEEPLYSYETVITAQHVIRDFLAPAMLSRPVTDLADLSARFNSFRGHNMAKAGLELAYLDLIARTKRQSLSALIGGTRTEVPVGVSLGIQPSVDLLLERVDRHLAMGYQRIKLKIKPESDIEFVREVRRRHPNIVLSVDANSAYTISDVDHLRELDDFGLLDD